MLVVMDHNSMGEVTSVIMEKPRWIWQGTDAQFLETLCKVVFYTGFSRQVVERRWTAFRTAFHDFDVQIVATFDSVQIEKLLQRDSGIVRNVRKVNGVVKNACICMDLCEKWGSMSAFCSHLSEAGNDYEQRVLQKTFYLIGESGARSLRNDLQAWSEARVAQVDYFALNPSPDTSK